MYSFRGRAYENKNTIKMSKEDDDSTDITVIDWHNKELPYQIELNFTKYIDGQTKKTKKKTAMHNGKPRLHIGVPIKYNLTVK